jgi:hypothetical protein
VGIVAEREVLGGDPLRSLQGLRRPDARANLPRWERQTIRDAKRQRQMQHSKSAQ